MMDLASMVWCLISLIVGYLVAVVRFSRQKTVNLPPQTPTNQDTLDSSDDETDEDDDDTESDSDDEMKLVLGVCMELKMQKGKAAAQCGHATLGAYKRACKRNPDFVRRWERQGQKKITVQIPDRKTLEHVQAQAEKDALPVYVVADAGRTQVEAGSLTVVAIGPAPSSRVDPLTRGYKLY